MGKGGDKAGNADIQKTYTWDEIRKHHSRDDQWIVIEGEVFDVSRWSRIHPGGSKVISHYAGQDASNVFGAFHKPQDLQKVRKYMKPILIGRVAPDQMNIADIDKDFKELKQRAVKMNLFKPSYFFFFMQFAMIMALQTIAYLNFIYNGVHWYTFIVTTLLWGTAQAQGGWLQHDFGHISVFDNTNLNRWVQRIFTGAFKGGSGLWWNHMHNQHHAKPNVMDKDPDVRIEMLFVVGDKMPLKVAEKKSYILPYNWQHKYFPLIGPPLLFPVYFQLTIARYFWQRKNTMKVEIFLFSLYYISLCYIFVPIIGILGTLLFYELTRVIESSWFTWVAQSNHIPMTIDQDLERPWVPLQMHATRNLQKSPFNDWFTGHLNFQIEHHLFPTMPRHNLYKIKPYVKELCLKHGIDYQEVSLSRAFKDILSSLRHSGELWFDAYYNLHDKHD
ncbi:acyl-CoA 6-desaturase-like [Saccoglossus kowalevskii]|uniref:Fatty acid desaturase 2-like n=1 Tax=Saccoglossus kowalevskii TaxID=10224 RepID=A0ABM0GT93_SACKO|nr:PREDICTED: fatty acid desaturase 2-like [Saccoglossus kowalevskii]